LHILIPLDSLSARVFHIPFIALASRLRLHAILQRTPTATNSAPDDHPAAKHFTSLDDLLADDSLDLVVISTPPDTHLALARAALQAGKHVLVEKPFVPAPADADALVALARERGRLLCVYQNRRWDADFATVRRLVREQALGRVYEFETHFDRYRPARPTTWKGQLPMAQGGGSLYDLGVHLLDQVYVLFGLPGSVSARFVNQRDGRLVTATDGTDEPDSFSALLSYADKGLLVAVRVGIMSVETKQPRFWIRGTKGSYHKNGLDPQEDQLKSGILASEAGFGVEDVQWAGRVCLAKPDGSIVEETCANDAPPTYLEFYELLGKALETGSEEDVPVPASQAADVLRIVAAVKESAGSGRDVIIS